MLGLLICAPQLYKNCQMISAAKLSLNNEPLEAMTRAFISFYVQPEGATTDIHCVKLTVKESQYFKVCMYLCVCLCVYT